jgi:hypothetical protein
MQPRFPPDHHFHQRTRNFQGARGDLGRSTNHAAPPESTVVYLIRQCLPTFDASDPRGPA